MTAKLLESMCNKYPESHLHCDVTQTGLHTYRVIASLISHDGDEIATVTHSGQSDLNTMKDQAYRLLAAEIFTPIKV